MPGYRNSYVTKNYVDRKLAESVWSPIQRKVFDIDDAVPSAAGVFYVNIENDIVDKIANDRLYTTFQSLSDGIEEVTCDYKIVYITVHLRATLGEDETLSGVSQQVRPLIWRSISTYNETYANLILDVDASPNWPAVFGDINGLWMDKHKYVHSWATDSDTTAAGNVFFFKKIKPKHSNTAVMRIDGSGDFIPVDTEKGVVIYSQIGDDPTGVNATMYGYIEVGYKTKTQ